MMYNCGELLHKLNRGTFDGSLTLLYPRVEISHARERIERSIKVFTKLYGELPVTLVSAPGRSEICGNHTDHQHGYVLAAAIDLDTLCVASCNTDGMARVKSEGHEPDEISLNNLEPLESEKGRSSALIRGVIAWFFEHGYRIGGFNAYTNTDVLSGSGLSSSAAFEIAIGNILKTLYRAEITPVELALAGQYAENKYFGKPCGLMDQMASSLGGMNMIDFGTPETPIITPVRYENALGGIKLCITDTGGSHADLTPEYAAIPQDMRRVAEYYGKTVLRDVDEAVFYADIPNLRDIIGDRELLRAMHYFSDDVRVRHQTAMIAAGDTESFLSLVRQSGVSSLTRLQNVFVPGETRYQRLPLALAISERILGDSGAWRVHGGGFAGTIQAFVPDGLLNEYCKAMNDVFGDESCKALSIRPVGGTQIMEG